MPDKDPSPHTTLVLLLGASTWPNAPELQPSKAFANSARGLRRYLLASNKFALPKENLLDCFDSSSSPDDLDQEIRQFLDQRLTEMEREGTPARDLLLYFVGHGGFTGRDFDFYLAIRRTRTDSLTTSGMRMLSLAETLKEKARYLRRLLLLDCCFAASATKFFQSPTPEQTAILQMCEAFKMQEKGTGMLSKGTSLLCSSGSSRPSLLSPDGRYTMFSGALLHTLHTGLQDHQGDLSLRTLAEATAVVLQAMPQWDAPRPELHSPDQSEGDIAEIPFFPNLALREVGPSRTAIVSLNATQPDSKTFTEIARPLIGAFLYGPHGRTVLGHIDVTIGRAADNVISLQDRSASEHHALIYQQGQAYWIRDLGSTNGTFVNQKRLASHSPQLLSPESTIFLGESSVFLYKVSSHDAQPRISSASALESQTSSPMSAGSLIDMNAVPAWMREANQPQEGSSGRPGRVEGTRVPKRPRTTPVAQEGSELAANVFSSIAASVPVVQGAGIFVTPGDPLQESQVTGALAQAKKFQILGRFNNAIGLCEQILESGFDQPDARYLLGWLYQEQRRWDEATLQFQTLLNDPDYALSCYYALGKCYRGRGDLRTAAIYFDEAVDLVDLDVLMREEDGQLVQLYKEAADAHRQLGEQEQALLIYKTLLLFLRGRGWNNYVTYVEYLLQQDQDASMPSLLQSAVQSALPPPPTPGVPTNSGDLPDRPTNTVSKTNSTATANQQPAQPVHPSQLEQASLPQPPSPYALPPIEILSERYELLDPIGRGGMATIYRGWDRRMKRTVAIKMLREIYNTDPEFVTRFQREAKAAAALQHPNIVQVYDYGQSDDDYFIVMELVEGTDLRRYLRSRGVLRIDFAIIIAHDVALGLGAAHRRSIVHRDVKPQNVLVGRDGSIKLADFGIASVYRDINATRQTPAGMTIGTVQYYAPEQALGEIVSPAADVYALGVVMYEMLTGRTPFDGDTPVAVAMQHIQDPPVRPSKLNPGIPPGLEHIILCCLEKLPEMRFHDGSQLARTLEMLEEGCLIPKKMTIKTRVNKRQ